MRKIIHIDMDAFFAAIEQRENPKLRGKPVIIGGKPGGRGVVATCSYEARAHGVHSAMATNKAYRLCPHAIFLPSRIALYRQVSQEIMAIFHKYSQRVEPLSLDEAFLDVSHCLEEDGSATNLARKICKDIKEQTGLTASAGVSYNKFLAKVASDIKKPAGITTIPPQKAQKFIDTLPIERFYGVGKVTKKKMLQLGIQNGKDLRQHSRDYLCKRFGKAGTFFYHIARGDDHREVNPHRDRKSIGKEITLAHDTNNPREIRDILLQQSAALGEILHTSKTIAKTITIKIRYSDFSTTTRSLSGRFIIYGFEEIEEILPLLLSHCNIGHKSIRLLGITLAKLEERNEAPRPLPLPFPKVAAANSLNQLLGIDEKDGYPKRS